MPSYKLIYFDGKGRAETSRLLFVLAGQEFEDFRFSREDWPKYKPTTPFGQAPVLEIDGKPFAQSNAIEAYLAREFGFHGKTNIEALEIDQVVQLVGDLYKEVVKAYFGEESKKEEMMKNFLEVEAPKYAKFFEKLLKENGTGYFVGKTITLADLSVYCALYGLSQRHQSIFDSYPEINAFINRVETHDKLKTYIASRKPTEF